MSTIGRPVIVLLDVHLLFSPTHPADGTAHPAAVVEGSATAPEVLLGPSGAPSPLDNDGIVYQHNDGIVYQHNDGIVYQHNDACVARHPAGGGR